MNASGPDDILAPLLRLAEGCSVLYVEDEPVIRTEITEMLETLFPLVVTAENGAQALEYCQKRDYELVITDINMPVMTGIEFIQTLRKTRPQQAVLVTSAYSDSANLIPLINLGVGSFILKPLNWKIFLSLVYKELSTALASRQETLYQKRLEKEVSLRTDELRETQRHVIRLQESKDNMLALISHELRTPLNGILGFVELIRTYPMPDEATDFLDHVEDSARRLERSTRKALDFASLSTGNRTLKREMHPVTRLLQAAQQLVSDRMDQLGAVEVQWELGQEGQLHTDSELVVEILRNLLENCAKYAGAQPVVTLRFHREGKWDLWEFQDSGPGFHEATLATLFHPFTTGNIMHHSEGMGLGLALIDVIMLTLGGRVEALNPPGGGALVRLRFPLPKAP